MNKSKENLLGFINKKFEQLESEKQTALEIYDSSRVNSVSQAKWGEIATSCWKQQKFLSDLKDEMNRPLID